MMYMVYWMGEDECDALPVTDLNEALKLVENKRNEGFKFVTMAYENPDMVGKQGSDKVKEDYNWYKRRRNPLLPVGR